MIEKTALVTLRDMVQAKIPYAKDILERISENAEPSGYAFLVESRYKTTEKILREGGFSQVVEFGAGFAPHSLNTSCELYVEVDLAHNSALKRKIVVDVVDKNIVFVSGDLLDERTWSKLSELIKNRRTAFFCEGLIQYFSSEQREFFFTKVHELLETIDGLFFFEDSLRFHPEILSLQNLSKEMALLSQENELLTPITQEILSQELSDFGFTIKRIPVIRELNTPCNDEAKNVLLAFSFWVLRAKHPQSLNK